MENKQVEILKRAFVETWRSHKKDVILVLICSFVAQCLVFAVYYYVRGIFLPKYLLLDLILLLYLIIAGVAAFIAFFVYVLIVSAYVALGLPGFPNGIPSTYQRILKKNDS